jgi:hypothetical protein
MPRAARGMRTLRALRHMEIGTFVTHEGRPCVLRGLDPMSIPDRRAHLEDAVTGERFAAPLAEVEPAGQLRE